jgi:hypothetical protein
MKTLGIVLGALVAGGVALYVWHNNQAPAPTKQRGPGATTSGPGSKPVTLPQGGGGGSTAADVKAYADAAKAGAEALTTVLGFFGGGSDDVPEADGTELDFSVES